MRRSRGHDVRAARDRRWADNGVVATEFIILAPIFVTLVIGMVWVGTTMFRWMNLELSAREGARFAAILPTGFPDDTPQSILDGIPTTAWFDAVLNEVDDASLGESTICVAYVGIAGSETAEDVSPPLTYTGSYVRQPDGTTAPGASPTCFPTSRGAYSRHVQVEVTGPVPLQGFGFWSGTLRGDATARFEAVYPRP
jgi:Flp pilus assembly protein TadG